MQLSGESHPRNLKDLPGLKGLHLCRSCACLRWAGPCCLLSSSSGVIHGHGVVPQPRLSDLLKSHINYILCRDGVPFHRESARILRQCQKRHRRKSRFHSISRGMVMVDRLKGSGRWRGRLRGASFALCASTVPGMIAERAKHSLSPGRILHKLVLVPGADSADRYQDLRTEPGQMGKRLVRLGKTCRTLFPVDKAWPGSRE